MTHPEFYNVSVDAAFRDARLSFEKLSQPVRDKAVKQSAMLRLAMFSVIFNRVEVVIFSIYFFSSSDEDRTFT